jgi:hypothetical protein
MAHTPGTWRVNPIRSGFQVNAIDERAGYPWPQPVVRGSGGVRRRDDAYLIAAAPDLLAACREACAHLSVLAVTHPHLSHPVLAEQLQRAIAAATGEEP